MNGIPDPVRDGLARGWRVFGGPHAPLPGTLNCDVAIIGSGAGAGITAELLCKAGLEVVLVEEGPLKSSSDFSQRESDAYPALYQESAARKTADKAINILQGRCVGGSTTVNWTSSFRTPPSTLEFWQRQFALPDYSEAALAPWFAQAERRLSIAPWLVPPNENNELLRRGARPARHPGRRHSAQRQGMLRTSARAAWVVRPMRSSRCWSRPFPSALDLGARLLVQTRARRFELERGRVDRLAVRCRRRKTAASSRPGRPASAPGITSSPAARSTRRPC